MEQVVNKFVEALKARIDFVNSLDDTLDSSKVDQINEIVSKYDELNSSLFSEEDLNIILNIIGITKTDDYEYLTNEIKDYIDECTTVKETHINNNKETINKYNKYIDLFTNGTTELFDDFDELDEVMAEVGLFIADKWQLISYLDNLNIINNKNKIALLNLNIKLNTYNKLYLSNKELNTYIDDYIKELNIDIDMIPSISKKLANNTFSEDTIRNTLSTIILNELYKDLNKAEDEAQITNLQKMVNNALLYIDNYEEKIIDPIKDIIIDYEELLNEEINKGNDINTYIDISLEDIEKLVGDHDKAINLKRLPLVKSMKDTLQSIDECDKSSDELINYLNLLGDLNKLYTETK